MDLFSGAVLLLLLVCCSCGVAALKEQKFAMEPQDQTAVVGSRVTLPCRVINKSGLLQWTRDGFGLGNLTGYDRYSITGSELEGDYSLNMYPVLIEDDAVFRCQVGAGSEGEPPIISRKANLAVLIPPEPPRIIQGSHLLTTENSEIQLECISVGGKPAAEITWVDGMGNLLLDGVEYSTELLPDQKTYTARSTMKLMPDKHHHNTSLTCQAQNTADRTYQSTRLRLEVKFAPKVKLVILKNGSRIEEGDDVRLKCYAAANPPELTYRWFINEQMVLGDPTTELVLRNVSQSQDKSVVKCVVHNFVGKTEDFLELNISYGPRFRAKPYSVQADLGTSVTLNCDVEGNPPPNIVWIHEDSDRVVSTWPNLTVRVASESAGRYVCRATVPGWPPISAEATVYVKGPPTIISHRTQFGIPGDTVRLECSAFSIPAPQKVVWSFQGENVESDLAYSVLEDQLAEGIKSTLIIQESQQEHFGVYNCTVSNPYGSDVVEITLKAQKSFPVQSTLIGITGGILMVVILMMILFLSQNNKRQPTGKKTDAPKLPRDSDLSSNMSDLKLEIEYSGDENDSTTGSDGGVVRGGLPLAGPVPLDLDTQLRYSHCYDTLPDNQSTNNGYVPYVDYARDYIPPTPLPRVSPETGSVDPQYSAIYGNPYLRHSDGLRLPPPPYALMRGLSARPTSLTTTQVPTNNTRGTLATHV